MGWMLVPADDDAATISFHALLPMRWDSLERGRRLGGFEIYVRFINLKLLLASVQATLLIVGGVLVITVTLGRVARHPSRISRSGGRASSASS